MSRLLALWLPLVLCAPSWAQSSSMPKEASAPAPSPSSVTKLPEVLERDEAVYPPEALREGRGGSVTLLVTLDEQGEVTGVSVQRPAGHGFDEAAVESVRRFRFSPAEVEGVPAAVQFEYVYHFVPPPPPKPAPTARLEGQLLARGSRSRIAGAVVRCAGQPLPEALSDEEGRFTLELPPGECVVQVRAEGFQPFTSREQLAEGERLELRYHLVPLAVGGQTVVHAERERKEVLRRSFSQREASRVPGTFGDPIRALQTLPGVGRPQYLLGALFVRGASPRQTRTLLDGVEVPNLIHVGTGPSVVNPEYLSRVDFFPGGFGARYGRAVGGIVEVSTRKGASDTLHGSVKLDLLDTGLFIEAPLSRGLSVSAAARRSWVDGILPLLNTQTEVPRYWDYQVRVDLGTSGAPQGSKSSSTGYLMAFGSDDLLRSIDSRGEVLSETRSGFHRLKGDWTLRHGAITSVFTPYVGYGDEAGDFGPGSYEADSLTLGAREDVTVELSEHLSLRTGVDLLFTRLNARAEFPAVGGIQFPTFPGSDAQGAGERLDRVIHSFDSGAYVEANLEWGPVQVTPGVRGNWARVHGQHLLALDPRLWVSFQPRPEFALRGSAGLFSQPPEGTQLEPSPYGNPLLSHERAFQSSLGVEYTPLPGVRVDLTGYYNRRYDTIIATHELLVLPDGTRQLIPYANKGLGRAYGLELLLRHAPTRNLFGWISYTLGRSEVRRAGGDPYEVDDFDQTHLLTLVGCYQLPWNLEVGARFRLASGRPMTRVQHPYDLYSADEDDFYPNLLGPPRFRLPAYHQLDVRVERHFVFDEWTLGLYLDLLNAYNAENTESLLYDYRFRYTVPIPGLPLLPVLGVKGTF